MIIDTNVRISNPDEQGGGNSFPTSKVRMSFKGISFRRICNPPELNIRIYNPLCLLSDFVLR